ncbi:polysaccharide biosynthesis C-terminal domain-containing protein [Perlabentimonas gracilis]|uniref:polysaccharide biosynthesis C-terminal domain-containing protein n=1 Tax=Perlabentimonas gracilis TaxID=2715279 RepID=UPI00140B0EB2|nr:NAD-dependent epimerase/dehydratase family protein [Perlabentimonas gracilis]NHB70193.1 SDR family oxidoreductase [Perlabentimonas gracilis]
MIKVGITGQAGFVGTHLYNTLALHPNKFQRIPFEDSYFQNEEKLKEFVTQCDAIVHLAAMNRHNDPEVIYKTNIGLVKQLITACEETNSTPHILFSSSTQEERDNLYGKSKKEGRELFEAWAQRNGAPFTGLVIPNVFGPFGHPYYNSVVATFCHQLTHNETPKIEVDGELKLIYVGELVDVFINKLLGHRVPQSNTQSNTVSNTVKHCETKLIEHTATIKVSKLLQLLKSYKENYFAKGIIPNLNNPFERNLFNTFVCYIDHKTFFPFHLDLKTDDRGSFVETVKLNSGGQVSFSTTKPGITRGNHFHTRKAERFAVIKGKARIELRRIGTNEVLSFELDGNQPSYVDMPIWYTHNITNVGNEDVYTIFWISEHFDADDPDTYFETV